MTVVLLSSECVQAYETMSNEGAGEKQYDINRKSQFVLLQLMLRQTTMCSCGCSAPQVNTAEEKTK